MQGIKTVEWGIAALKAVCMALQSILMHLKPATCPLMLYFIYPVVYGNI